MEATVADTGGHLLVHATSRCVRMDVSGELPRSPLANLLGIKLRDVADKQVVCEIPAGGWFVNPGGTVYSRVQALLADYTILGAVQSTVPADTSWATLDLKFFVTCGRSPQSVTNRRSLATEVTAGTSGT